jgi:arginine utilization regulatory protein
MEYMSEKYIKQILNIYNHVDTIILTDTKGYITYFITYRPDVNPHKPAEMIGKHMLEAFPTLTEESSTVMRVIRTGKAILNELQEFPYDGYVVQSINSTIPIIENGRIVGVANMVRYLDGPFKRNEIVIDMKEKKDFGVRYGIDDIEGCSESIFYLKQKVRMVAETDSPVLIYGETGTGKELAAQAIHSLSGRRENRFVSLNCAAIPESLLESVLFGTVKGAYTGAENRPGFFEISKGGTLFLDEINSMEISLQAKLLRVIEDNEVTRIGGSEPVKTDVRIISALNENPMECIKNRKLRRDLFYRLSVVEIDIEPLRKRKEDIPYMTDYYINYYNKKMNRAITGIDEEVEKIFMKYDWPGNVRELKNLLEGAFNIATSRSIKKKYLPGYLLNELNMEGIEAAEEHIIRWSSEDGFNLDEAIKEYEKNIIISAVRNSRNLSEAAKKLGISRQNLNYKLNKHSLLENNTLSKYNIKE